MTLPVLQMFTLLLLTALNTIGLKLISVAGRYPTGSVPMSPFPHESLAELFQSRESHAHPFFIMTVHVPYCARCAGTQFTGFVWVRENYAVTQQPDIPTNRLTYPVPLSTILPFGVP